MHGLYVRYGLASAGLATEALDELVLAMDATASGQIGVHAFLAELRARGIGIVAMHAARFFVPV